MDGGFRRNIYVWLMGLVLIVLTVACAIHGGGLISFLRELGFKFSVIWEYKIICSRELGISISTMLGINIQISREVGLKKIFFCDFLWAR